MPGVDEISKKKCNKKTRKEKHKKGRKFLSSFENQIDWLFRCGNHSKFNVNLCIGGRLNVKLLYHLRMIRFG